MIALGVLGAWALPASSAPDVGSARGDVRQARAELHEIDLQLSLAAERLHEGKALLATLRAQLGGARERSEQADAHAAGAAESFDSMVRWAYESGAS